METERLNVYPADKARMEALIAAQTDDGLKAAYRQMLEESLAHPDTWDWYAAWIIERKDGTHVGDLCFKGLTGGSAEIGYGILEAYRGCGYAAEAVQAAVNWAFGHAFVDAVEAETEPGNIASQKVLAKCGFRPTGETGEEGPRFILTRDIAHRSKTMEFIKITEKEIDGLWALHTAYKEEIGEDAPTAEDKARLAGVIGRGEILFYGCADGGTLVACCSVSPTFSTFNYARCGVFEDFYIRPENRGKGIARGLVNFAYRESGVGSLTVGCADCDLEMYKALGFSIPLGNLLAYDA